MLQMQLQKSPLNIQSDLIDNCKDILKKKKFTLFFKSFFDIFAAIFMLLLLSPAFVVCAIAVACVKDGPVFFKQERIGKNGKPFKIIKFRTMTDKNEGTAVTVSNDSRVTKPGRILRKFRLDELPQLINVIKGDMSFVGPRPEVPHYVEKYEDDWYATLLVKPGITCRSSIYFADESDLMENAEDADSFYTNSILPDKCKMNIDYIRNLSVIEDVKILFATVKRVLN